MNSENSRIVVSGLTVEVVRKDIRNLHLGVYPPLGRVRVAAPLRVSNDAVRLAVIGKLGWIRKQRARFAAQPRQSLREMVTGESHYFLGRRYRLRVCRTDGAAGVVLRGHTVIQLSVRPDATAEQREQVLQHWYRGQLKALIAPLLAKWEPVVKVEAAEWGVRRMKTKWGSCNAEARRIWLNLELAKKPAPCLEYIVVHELVHLLERRHNRRFTGLMEQVLPHWRQCRAELNHSPLGHDDWVY